jgi:hypothetical protein
MEQKLASPTLAIKPQNVDEKLKLLAREVRTIVRQDYDLVIAISGLKGTGKSDLAEDKLAPLIDDTFDLDRNVAYLPEYDDIEKKFNNVGRYGVLAIDEAIKAFYKLNFMDGLQIELTKFYNTNRKGNNKVTILCIPSFFDLTKQFRKDQVFVWIHIIHRGIAVVYKRDSDKDVEDPWHVMENIAMKKKFFAKKSIARRDWQDYLRAERLTKNYWFDFQFGDWNPENQKVYDRLANYYKNLKKEEDKKTETATKREEMWRQRTSNAVHLLRVIFPRIRLTDIQDLMGFPHPQTSLDMLNLKATNINLDIKAKINEILAREEKKAEQFDSGDEIDQALWKKLQLITSLPKETEEKPKVETIKQEEAK